MIIVNYDSDSDNNDKSYGEEVDARKFKGMIFYCTELLIFMGIIFCSSVDLLLNFNTTGIYNFATKKANILVNLVPSFNDVSFSFCHFLNSGVTNELKGLFS